MRIKSILRYKKPLKLLTAPVAVFAVVFSLLLISNPQIKTGKAANVIPEFPDFGDNLFHYSIGIHAQNAPSSWSFSGGHEEIAPMVYGFLQNLEVEYTPASESRVEDRDATNSIYLMTSGKNKVGTDFNFSHDFSRIWIDNGVKPSYTYVVKNPDSVREMFSYLLTGETESLVLNTAIESCRVAAEEGYIVAIYCPAATQTQGFIQVGELHASYVSSFLCTKLENEYGYPFDLGSFDWDETHAPANRPASPESVEFVIRDDLRVQIWKKSQLAVIRDGDKETWFKTPRGDYWEAVELVKEYSLTPTEVQERLETEAEGELLLEPETTVTPAPTGTPSSIENPDAIAQATTAPAPTSTPQPTPETAVKTS